MSNWERIADALANELRSNCQCNSCADKPKSEAIALYDKAKERDYIVDVDELSASDNGPCHWTAKASHLGWTAGFWPLVIRFRFVVLRNQRPVLQNGVLHYMQYDDGFNFVKIYND